MLLINKIDCGNTIKGSNGPAPDGNAKCDMKCLGNPNEICGGPNRMNLYSHNAFASTSVPATVKEVSTREQTSTSMAAGVTGTGDSAWHYRGCYTDCGAGTLAHGNPTSDTMTVAKCQAMCLAQGYCLAGLEWGDECCEFLPSSFPLLSSQFHVLDSNDNCVPSL